MTKGRKLVIEKIADDVRNECSATGFGVRDIFDSAEKAGYRVIRYPIGTDSFLGLAMIKESEKIIFSNSSQILSREIFTAAHEIGHHKLHISEQGKTIIIDDDLNDRDNDEAEANYFAACYLTANEKVRQFIRFELNDKSVADWNGLDIARIQTAFNVSYDMALIRLKDLGFLNDEIQEYLKLEKVRNSTSKLLSVIDGNLDLCKAAEVKKVPAEYLEWAISNYNEKLIPQESLKTALQYVDLKVEDIEIPNSKNKEKDI